MATLIPLLIATPACDDATGPPPFEVSISGPTTISPYHGYYEDGGIRVQCDVTLTVRASSGDSNASAAWTGGRLRWFRAADSTLTTTETLTAADAAARIWGGPEIRAGASGTASATFWAPQLFRVVLEFNYRTADRRMRVSTHEFDCVPVAPGLSGRYRLSTIGDDSLPAYSLYGDEVHAASLDFSAHNLTYRSRSRGIDQWSTVWDTTELAGYEVEAEDHFRIPSIIPDIPSVRVGVQVIRTEKALFFTESWGDLPNVIWRFDLDEADPGISIFQEPSVIRDESVSLSIRRQGVAGWTAARGSVPIRRDH